MVRIVKTLLHPSVKGKTICQQITNRPWCVLIAIVKEIIQHFSKNNKTL